MIPKELKYTEDHEWVFLEDSIATVGITSHAIEELGEIVFVELPKLNSEISQMDEAGTIESVKTVSSIFAPLSGSIEEVNDELETNPSTLNEQPFGDGWIFKIKVEDDLEYQDLMTHEEYATFLENL